MLSESFIAASSAAPALTTANASQVKDAGIFMHSLQPQPSLRSTLKKSAAAPNCLAVSCTHVFAAQKDKAVVHVYNRDRGNQEAAIPFPERIESIVLTCNDTLLVFGTAGGRLLLWDTTSGRILSTSASHLQSINVLAADSGNFILSGSGDGSVLVWCVVDILSFGSLISHENTGDARGSLSGHTAGITALAMGSSASTANIAVSAARDKTLIVWDYISGTKLRTILLDASATCLSLDVADRAVYSGYDDGSVQRVDFYDTNSHTALLQSSGDSASTPLRPFTKSRWAYNTTDNTSQSKSVLSLAVTHDGTRIISGHANGAIIHWDVSSERMAGTLASYPGAPITNMYILPLGHLDNTTNSVQFPAQITKPRPHEEFSRMSGGFVNGQYALHLTLPQRRKSRTGVSDVDYSLAMHSVGFSSTLIKAGALELEETPAASSDATGSRSDVFDPAEKNTDADFLPITDPGEDAAYDFDMRLSELRDVLNAKDRIIEKLQKERTAFAARERESLKRRGSRASRRETKHDDFWRSRATNGQNTLSRREKRTSTADDSLTTHGRDQDSSSDVMSQDDSSA